MVKIRTLVPLTHPKTGEQFAAGAEVDVAEDVFNEWHADGKASSIADEKAQAEQPGVYGARTGREDVAGTKAEEPKPAPKEKK